MHCQWQQLSSTTTKKYMVVVLGKIRQLSIILPEYVWITYEGLKFTPHVTTIKDLHFLFSKMTHLEIYLYTYMYTQTIIKQLLTTSCITERTQWSKPFLGSKFYLWITESSYSVYSCHNTNQSWYTIICSQTETFGDWYITWLTDNSKCLLAFVYEW